MKRKTSALLLALVLLALASCAPTSTEKEDASKQPDPPNALESEPSDSPETQTDPVDISDTVHFDSQLGCSADYDPLFFTAEDYEDEYYKYIVGFYMSSIWENNGFHIGVSVNPLDVSSIEEAVKDVSINKDGPGEEAIFGAGNYTAIRFTYNNVYAVGEIYLTEQNGTVFEVKVSSYYQPPEKEHALAYAILDSITF